MKRGIFISYRWIAVALVGLAAIFWTVSNITAQPPIPHAVPAGIDTDCLSCHQAGVADAPRLAWDHLGRTNDDCQQCHVISGNLSVPIPHDIDGQEECHDCHLDGSAGAPRVAGVHAAYEVDTCQTCHPHVIEVEEPVEVEEPQVSEAVIQELEAVGEEEVETLNSLAAEATCQKCHWQMSDRESHSGVVEAQALPADQGILLFAELCASCHGEDGQTEAFPANILALQALLDDPEAELEAEEIELASAPGSVINSAAYLSTHDDANVMQAIIGIDPETENHTFADVYGGPLAWDEVVALVAYIRTWDQTGPPGPPQPQLGSVPSFAQDIYPIFEESCAGPCHLTKQKGDWSMKDYEAVMTTGKNAPTIIPGDPDTSLLAQKLQDRQEIGKQMPLRELLPSDQINLILEWIRAGAPNN